MNLDDLILDPDLVDVIRVTTRMNVGGIARHVSWLSAGLADSGYQTVLIAGVVPPGEDDMSDFARGLGVEPVVLPEMSREISLRDLVTIWKLYRLFVKANPKIVHTHAAKAGMVGRFAGLLYRWLTPSTLVGRPRVCRFVHTYHGHIFHSYYGTLKTWLFLMIERVLAQIATDRIVVISEQQYREIHERFRVGRPGQLAVIPLGLDLGLYCGWEERRRHLRDELRTQAGDVLVGIVGRLTEIKNHKLFLQVAANIQRNRLAGGRVRFLVIGDGHLRAELERQAREEKLEGCVEFLGMRHDPEQFYPGLDVVAITSLNEGTPLTLIEAMANARAVIATNVGGVIDLVGAAEEPPADAGYSVCERGVLVRASDAVAFSRGLARLIDDAELRRDLGQRGLAFVQRCYGKERLLSDMADLYAGLTGRNGRIEKGSVPREATEALA